MSTVSNLNDLEFEALRKKVLELETKLAAEKTKGYKFEASVITEPRYIETPMFNVTNGKKYPVMVYDREQKKTVQQMERKVNPAWGRMQIKLPHTVSVQNRYYLSEIEEILDHALELRSLIEANRETMAEAERAYVASK